MHVYMLFKCEMKYIFQLYTHSSHAFIYYCSLIGATQANLKPYITYTNLKPYSTYTHCNAHHSEPHQQRL